MPPPIASLVPSPPTAIPIPAWHAVRPEAVWAAWPAQRPLAALRSGADAEASRWVILAEPESAQIHQQPAEAIRLLTAHSAAAPAPFDRSSLDPHAPPFLGGWIGQLSYHLGQALESASGSPAQPASTWPAAAWFFCPRAWVFDRLRQSWWAVGPSDWTRQPPDIDPGPASDSVRGFDLGPLRPTMPAADYQAAVRRALSAIAAGDIYQVNLTHALHAEFTGSTRALFAALAEQLRPWYGAYLELPDSAAGSRRAIACASPELFLSFDPRTRRVETRPMKGTRRASADPAELRDNPKEQAELCMIIDLMRNDLGRVAAVGSVTVAHHRAIEQHGRPASPGESAAGVWQATATISAILREGLTLAHLLRATFPGGSVTGAPKIAAMQQIARLETFARGPYCGLVGYVSICGHAAANIAIRTALIEGEPDPASTARDAIRSGTLTYPVGAGIVADSDPLSEWRETLDKAAGIAAIVTHAPHAPSTRAAP